MFDKVDYSADLYIFCLVFSFFSQIPSFLSLKALWQLQGEGGIIIVNTMRIQVVFSHPN
jgi:hypothetical protein